MFLKQLMIGSCVLIGASGICSAQAQDGSDASPVPHLSTAPRAPARPKKPPQPKVIGKPSDTNMMNGAASGPAGAPPPPSNVVKLGTWVISCANKTSPSDPPNCLALISVSKDKTDQRRIVILGLIRNAAGTSFFVQTPTTVALKPGADVQFEGQAAHHFEYSSCEPALCTVNVPLDDAVAAELVGTPTATVLWTSLAAGQVKVQFSTAGARQAFDYLRAQ